MQGMPILPALILASAALLVGCVHWDSERNAPGHIDVLKPPIAIECEVQERPDDPGENIINFLPSVYMGGGTVGLSSADGSPAFAIGAETSLLYGSNESSHEEDSMKAGWLRHGLGFNVGLYSFSRKDRLMTYGELLWRRGGLNISPGWAWNLQSSRHGPQLTVSMMGLYMRATHLLDSHTDLSFGLYLGPTLAWIWSR